MRVDYDIQCYAADWNAFHPIVILVLLLFTIGFPVILIAIICLNYSKLYTRSFYAKMGFLYERYIRGTEWWEIHEMFRKMTLTGLLLFAR